MQTAQLLYWSDMTDTEHSTTSGSNEASMLEVFKSVCILYK